MSVPEQILGVFREGPGMIADIVLETGMAPRQVSGSVNYLVRTGKSTVWLYYLPSQEVRR